MNELLQSVKADLLSRHLLPLLAVAGVALLGALAYIALGSGGGQAKPPMLPPAAPVPSGLPVAIAPPSTTTAAAETPAGLQYQTQGPTRDPFSSLGVVTASGVTTTSASTTASNSTSTPTPGSTAGAPGGASTSGGGGSSSSKAGAAPPSPPSVPGPVPKRSSPTPTPKPEIVPFYDVSALFGPAPANPGEPSTLTPYEDMKRFEPLPSAKGARIVFAGVVSKDGRQRAVFGLVTPPILRGQASCFPSATHCQWIELGAGKSEELEYVNSNGEAAAFELKVVKIVKHSSPAGASESRSLRASTAGRRELVQAGLSPLGWAEQAAKH